MTTIKNLLTKYVAKLHLQKSPSLDAEVLLSFVLNKPREYILSRPEETVAAEKAATFINLIKKRAARVPAAYLVKNKEFYGRDFYVDERAHIPRPATEDLIDFIQEKIPADFSGTIADIGSGSGCIAVTLAILYPQASLIATDISSDALKVAAINATKNGVEDRIIFAQGDLFAALPNPVDIIISNPPYGWPASARQVGGLRRGKPERWSDDPEVAYQPKISYDGGKGGLGIIKRLIAEAPLYLKNDGRLFFEFDPRQRSAVETHCMRLQCLRLEEKQDAFNASLQTTRGNLQTTRGNFSHQIKKDLAGFDRIAYLQSS